MMAGRVHAVSANKSSPEHSSSALKPHSYKILYWKWKGNEPGSRSRQAFHSLEGYRSSESGKSTQTRDWESREVRKSKDQSSRLGLLDLEETTGRGLRDTGEESKA